MGDIRQVALRIDSDLLARIDTRADANGWSRNEWLVRALAWAVDQPSKRVAEPRPL